MSRLLIRRASPEGRVKSGRSPQPAGTPIATTATTMPNTVSEAKPADTTTPQHDNERKRRPD
ncbi:hypothetical protein [Chitinivorax sp. B]|uniref:hypothetical protein n=1 Tax=Chitinivorax sp. B TaxID=2502235 RepID=UPI0010F64EF8|nr:hypothetical protein [Chitinivorax sp. B]